MIITKIEVIAPKTPKVVVLAPKSGPSGDRGEVGPSNYQRAVELGIFQGSEVEYLESLKASGVRTVNGLEGQSITLTPEDVGADPQGSAQAVKTSLQLQLQDLENKKLNAVDYVQHFRGLFSSYQSLSDSLPDAIQGDYAHIDSGTGFDRLLAIWDGSDSRWVVTGANLSSTSDEVTEGSTNLYFKSSRVLDTPMTGVSAPSPSPVIPTDSLILAISKLQSQIQDILTKSPPVTWVTWNTIGTMTNIYFSSSLTVEPLQFARINDTLWIRGTISATIIASPQMKFKMNNSRYICRVANSVARVPIRIIDSVGNSQFTIFGMTATGTLTQESHFATVEYGLTDIFSGSLAPGTWRIPPQPIGELLIK